MNYYESHHSGEALKTLNWDANSLRIRIFHIFIGCLEDLLMV